jgi:hypothetical protein
MAVNCIGTDVQDRCNGEDFDSDFNLVTNHPTIVRCAKRCYAEYPTIVNSLNESGVSYGNSKTDYSNMDNKFSGSQMGIGWSSNLAQLAMTYYWTELAEENPDETRLKELYDNFVILSVLAQVIIDGCKRVYEIDGEDEIKRISQLPCMSLTKQIEDENGKEKNVKCDFPEFMKYTKEIPYTKDGKELPFETVNKNKKKLRSRINYDLKCPMNWLEEWLDKIQNISSVNSLPTRNFFIKMSGYGDRRQMSKIRQLIEVYDGYVKQCVVSPNKDDDMFSSAVNISNEILEKLSKIKIGNVVTINRLIETSLGLEVNNNRSLFYKDSQKYTRKMLNMLYKMDKNKFLNNFICENCTKIAQ